MASLRYNLNRKLAGTHGVVLNNTGTYFDEERAANLLAGTEGYGLVGALNQWSSPGRSAKEYLDLQGVLNELAGTTGLGVEGAADQL